jgi:hypothetical protein
MALIIAAATSVMAATVTASGLANAQLATRSPQSHCPDVSRWLPLLLLLSCAHAAPTPAPPPPPAPVTPQPAATPPAATPPDSLTLERTACSGSCPVYTLTLQPTGQVHFVGAQDVAAKGERDWRIDALYAKHLFGEFEHAHFDAFAPRYPTEVAEFPGFVLTLTRAGVVHRVQLGGEGTEDLERDVDAERLLKRLAQTIDKLTASGRFVETDSKKQAGRCVE